MPGEQLAAIFDADRAMRAAEKALFEKDQQAVQETLSAAVVEASALQDPAEAEMRLQRLADLCAQIPGPEMADALIAIMDHEEPRVRVNVAEALLDVAYAYYAEVARAIDRALDDGSKVNALAELPFLLVEVGEPGAAKQLKRFLLHDDGQVVAAAIEASVELGDVDMEGALFELTDDGRDVTMDEFEIETSATVGELARDAIKLLETLKFQDET